MPATVHGEDEVVKALRAKKAMAPAASRAWLTVVSQRISSEAKFNCPVDTGDLRADIHPVVKSVNYAEVRSGDTVNYAKPVHNGTSRGLVGRPYLLKAAEDNRRRAMEMAKQRFKDLT